MLAIHYEKLYIGFYLYSVVYFIDREVIYPEITHVQLNK